MLGKEHPDKLASMNNVAMVLMDQGKCEQAEETHRQAFRLMETVLGKEHLSTLAGMNNLAMMLRLRDQGKYEQTEEILRQTLRLMETVLGKEHLDTLTSMNDLATVLMGQSKYEHVEEMYQKALAAV